MSFSNLRLLSTLILVIVLCSSIQSRRRKLRVPRIDGNTIRDQEQTRPIRGFADMDLSTAHGFGKRSENMQRMNRMLMNWITMGNNPKNSRTSEEWLTNQDTDYIY